MKVTSPKKGNKEDNTPKKKRTLMRMDTTPSPSKVRDLGLSVLPVPSHCACWFDMTLNMPFLKDGADEKRIADEVVHENGFIVGLWKSSPYTWWTWQSDITLTHYVGMNNTLADDEDQDEDQARPKAKAMKVKKKPAALMKKPVKEANASDAKTMNKWVEDMVIFENSPHGLELNRKSNHIRSRVYHKIRVLLETRGLEKDNLLPLVKQVMASVEHIE